MIIAGFPTVSLTANNVPCSRWSADAIHTCHTTNLVLSELFYRMRPIFDVGKHDGEIPFHILDVDDTYMWLVQCVKHCNANQQHREYRICTITLETSFVKLQTVLSIPSAEKARIRLVTFGSFRQIQLQLQSNKVHFDFILIDY